MIRFLYSFGNYFLNITLAHCTNKEIKLSINIYIYFIYFWNINSTIIFKCVILLKIIHVYRPTLFDSGIKYQCWLYYNSIFTVLLSICIRPTTCYNIIQIIMLSILQTDCYNFEALCYFLVSTTAWHNVDWHLILNCTLCCK